MYRAQRLLEDHRINRADHLPRPHFTQITAALAGRAGGVLAREQVEGLAGFQRDLDLSALAEKSDRFTGADLEDVVRRAGLIAIRSVLNTEPASVFR